MFNWDSNETTKDILNNLNDPVYKWTVERKPFQCPVCYGKGTVPPGFYTGQPLLASLEREQCKSCCGKGVIWG